MAAGNNITLRRNHLQNVDFGITVSGNYALVANNTIENFAGDGLRGLGNDLFFEYNMVKNCYAVNANHDDGFQSWSINGDPPRERVVLRGNTIINATDPNQPFKGNVQGIGCFDGWYIDWIVENNVIITDHWHGISLYGARNCRIVNNTAIGQTAGATTGPPWIGFFKHKDGTPNSNCITRNNIARTIQAGEGSSEDHNYLIPGYASYAGLFVDHLLFNLRLKPGVAPIDAGSVQLAPTVDITGVVRPRGAAVDIGAYEQ
jgi:parallel beta-helix repeat protein